MVFWILGAAIFLSIVGFAFVYKLAMNEKPSTIDPKPKDVK